MGSSLNEQIEEMENLTVSLLEKAGIPGASLAIVMGNKMVYSKGFGARDLENNLPATSETLYGIASCSKSFTALAIMQLVEQGKINLEDSISDYLPLKFGKEGNNIKIHHLLTMSSGLPDTGLTRVILDRFCRNDKNVFQVSSWEQIYSHLNGSSDWMIDPEKRFFYSNESYALLAQIIEKVSQMPFPDYMREHVFKPLCMNRTTYLKEDFEKEKDKMVPYMEGIKRTDHPFNTFIDGCGGILSSVNELANYLIAIMNGGIFADVSVISKDSINSLTNLHFECNMASSYLGKLGKEGYGYGWMIIENYLGVKWVAHLGQIPGSSAGIIFLPEKKMGVIIACNTGEGQGLMAAIPIIILATLIGTNPMELPFISVEEKLAMLTGEYQTYKAINKLTISKQDSNLFVKCQYFWGDKQVPLISENDDINDFKFYIISGPTAREPIEFLIKSKSEIDLLYERYHFRKV